MEIFTVSCVYKPWQSPRKDDLYYLFVTIYDIRAYYDNVIVDTLTAESSWGNIIINEKKIH